MNYAYDWVQTINSEKYKRTQYPSRQFAKNCIPTNNNKDLKKNDYSYIYNGKESPKHKAVVVDLT